MDKLARLDLLPLEEYAQRRDTFRAQVLAHKRDRKLHIGPHLTLYFEDRLTVHYQIQEMLRVERIFEDAGIAEELEAYNPLIPDGSNWKATLMIEYADVEERQVALTKLIGIEERVWIQVDGSQQVWPIADEDLDRATEDKTSAVHFLRFELTPEMCAAVQRGASLNAGSDHAEYRHEVRPIATNIRDSLANDLG